MRRGVRDLVAERDPARASAYDRTLRSVRRAYAAQVEQMRFAVAQHFPEGTRISRPAGGFVLWIELPEGSDSELLFRDALERGVSITPGTLFSASRRFRRYVRLSAGLPFDDRVAAAVAEVGALACQQCQAGS